MDEVSGEGGGVKTKSASSPEVDQLAAAKGVGEGDHLNAPPSDHRMTRDDADATPMDDGSSSDYLGAGSSSFNGVDTPLSRSSSSDTNSGLESFGQDAYPPMDRLTMFDILENFALPQRLESIQNSISDNAEKLRKQRAKLASRALSGKNNLVGEWRKRVPQSARPEEQLDKYRRRMGDSVDRINKRWDSAKSVTLNEKISFVTAVLNVFISGYLIGGWPQYFHYWYTVQMA